MKKIILYTIVSYMGFLAGCTGGDDVNENQNAEGLNNQPIHYDTQGEDRQASEEEQESIGEEGPKGYPQKYQDRANSSEYEHGYSDPYTNEDTEEIAENLEELDDVVQAQVEETNDRLIIGLQLKEHTDPDRPDDIEEQVKALVPPTDKEIFVFTDKIYWDRMKNLDSRGRSGEDINDLFEDFPPQD
ncbi:YhcN/YlaJ family sporulation lipoprotein [Virgibacillus sediminis]|uniref:YhcN/YlaJ family sporulation lipoprotein n=1 Tax=Virgibacillus sediminis TaxID=202260 RepID=A0ABV7A6S0_9BACI